MLFNGALSNFTQADFTNAGFPTGARETVQRVAEDEQAHANFIKEAIIEAGGTPVEPCDYTFRESNGDSWWTRVRRGKLTPLFLSQPTPM